MLNESSECLSLPGHVCTWTLETCWISAWLPLPRSSFSWNENKNNNTMKPGLWATGLRDTPSTSQPGCDRLGSPGCWAKFTKGHTRLALWRHVFCLPFKKGLFFFFFLLLWSKLLIPWLWLCSVTFPGGLSVWAGGHSHSPWLSTWPTGPHLLPVGRLPRAPLGDPPDHLLVVCVLSIAGTANPEHSLPSTPTLWY